ncbi:hypothetical protein ACFY5D_18060 [Paeniglutamicibacter sp. NPDC012692]|uniref:hypothetical protein n=1 Tax=Paeniglutamicibacter sp. NPDC012692 TaxID=3364388 RepID=UPI0036960ECF
MALELHPTFTELPRERRREEVERGRARYRAQVEVHHAFRDQYTKRQALIEGTAGPARVHAITDALLAEEQTREAHRKLTRLHAELEWMTKHE